MNPESYKILLVDDEADILEFLSYNLEKSGYITYKANNGQEALELARQVSPHLVLMDVMMPGMDGIETCEEMRKIPSLQQTVIAFLTARAEDYSQIAGFEAGGDDYINKPVKPKVLVSRIKALLKRYESITTGGSDNLEGIMGDLVIDKERFIVLKGNEELMLPKKEFELLNLLISKPNKVFSRDEIFKSVWGDNIIVGDRTIDVHIRKLREKIGNEYIQTIKGVGYKFVGSKK